MKKVFAQPESIVIEQPTAYCPGCGHGIAMRLIAEAIDELKVAEESIAVFGIGCYSLSQSTMRIDRQSALHGRAPAVATGIKRMLTDRVVFTIQGDGDLAGIGAAEVIHAATRGDRITCFFLNNAGYGETGGQMAPTTLLGQRTPSTPKGRDPIEHGYPIRMSEMLAQADGSAYIARVAMNTPANINRAKKAVKKALQTQMAEEGFSLVEFLVACPSGWRMDPLEALEYMANRQIPTYPLGELKSSKVAATEVA